MHHSSDNSISKKIYKQPPESKIQINHTTEPLLSSQCKPYICKTDFDSVTTQQPAIIPKREPRRKETAKTKNNSYTEKTLDTEENYSAAYKDITALIDSILSDERK